METSELYRAINNFFRISGMEIAVGDSNHHSVTSSRCRECNFCMLVHSYPNALDLCSESDMAHILKMERLCTPVQYTCPLGIEEVLFPIMRDGELGGYVFCSMGILDEVGDSGVLERCERELGIRGAELSDKVRAMPHFTREEMDAYIGIIAAVCRYIETERLLPEREETVGQLVKNYVKENIARKITLSDIAWNLHCSTVTLTEHFKREFGISIMQYVMKKRMELAESMMEKRQLPLGEIALFCGFSDVEYFSRCFKKYHGASPREWRRRK